MNPRIQISSNETNSSLIPSSKRKCASSENVVQENTWESYFRGKGKEVEDIFLRDLNQSVHLPSHHDIQQLLDFSKRPTPSLSHTMLTVHGPSLSETSKESNSSESNTADTNVSRPKKQRSKKESGRKEWEAEGQADDEEIANAGRAKRRRGSKKFKSKVIRWTSALLDYDKGRENKKLRHARYSIDDLWSIWKTKHESDVRIKKNDQRATKESDSVITSSSTITKEMPIDAEYGHNAWDGLTILSTTSNISSHKDSDDAHHPPPPRDHQTAIHIKDKPNNRNYGFHPDSLILEQSPVNFIDNHQDTYQIDSIPTNNTYHATQSISNHQDYVESNTINHDIQGHVSFDYSSQCNNGLSLEEVVLNELSNSTRYNLNEDIGEVYSPYFFNGFQLPFEDVLLQPILGTQI